ncbi:MAG TPA: hypothetical protein VFC67_20970 [Prolixibacteraceae bacterium]|nr:hypothetical protein [Prolixibacteraceae bacterium]
MDFNNSMTQLILGIIAAIIGTGLIFKFVIKKNSTKNTGSVNIRKSKIKGDVAGRDIKK